MACSEDTIGAGDQTNYWDYQHRKVERADLGHRCRECRRPFKKLGEPLTERRGARVSMRYHAECFSGFADPRSQASSSHHVGRLAGTQFEAAPKAKAGSKMRTGKQFDSRSDRRAVSGSGGGGSGKIALAMAGGHTGFGSKSSKDRPADVLAAARCGPGGFTEDQLAEHTQRMQLEQLEQPEQLEQLEQPQGK